MVISNIGQFLANKHQNPEAIDINFECSAKMQKSVAAGKFPVS